MQSNIRRKIYHKEFLQRENLSYHHSYDVEMLQFELIKNGDPQAVDEAAKIFVSEGTGPLSDDPVRNAMYHFVCSVALSCRFCIEGGMDAMIAFHASDLFIQNADKLKSVDELRSLHKEMTAYYVNHMANLKRQRTYSKPVILSMDYVYDNLHQVITVAELADASGVSTSYLSTLFKNETGMAVSEYIRRRRVEAAGIMLKYSDYSLTEISQFLAFSSPTHFSLTFKKYTGLTPKEYRKKLYRKTDLVQ